MDNNRWIVLWRLAPSSATLTNGFLVARKIPPPDLADYRDYSTKVPQSQGGLARQGYIRLSLLWNQLDFVQFKALNDVVEAAITNGSIYGTVDKADGTGFLNAFIDISGVSQPLDHTPISSGRGILVSNVQLVINNITVINDPSSIL